MLRRTFLATSIAAAAAPTRLANSVLVHEHVLVDFIGAKDASRDRYRREDVVKKAVPPLKEAAARGCVRMLECTPNFLGRDPLLLQELSQKTGIELWTNTGLYAANGYRHLPDFARTETAEQLAKRWIAEAKGIEGVKPRFIKIGVNRGPLPDLDKKIVRAAAIACRETGLTIAAHTGDGIAALEELEIVQSERVALKKFVWVHAQNDLDHEARLKAAKAGAWVELDGISPQSADRHLVCLRKLIDAGLIKRVLISQDAGWYHVGEPEGGNYRGYSMLYDDFLPRLSSAEAKRLMIDNPRQAFGR